MCPYHTEVHTRFSSGEDQLLICVQTLCRPLMWCRTGHKWNWYLMGSNYSAQQFVSGSRPRTQVDNRFSSRNDTQKYKNYLKYTNLTLKFSKPACSSSVDIVVTAEIWIVGNCWKLHAKAAVLICCWHFILSNHSQIRGQWCDIEDNDSLFVCKLLYN